MILYQWRGRHPNFGDELNALLWPALLPDFFDQDEATRFLGIGSILDDRHGGKAHKIVAGAGYGGYQAIPKLDATWSIHWVRGPRTAGMLGLSPSIAIGDPASLVPFVGIPAHREDRAIGFMPHFESVVRGAWQDVAAAAGVTLIDPRGDPATIIASIARCRVMLSEALHGVIVADALRVPWVAIRPLAAIHRPKWLDWAETLGLTISFRPLPPSTALERAHLSRIAGFHTGRSVLERHAARLRGLARESHVAAAANALRHAAAAEPLLSPPARLDDAQSRMMEAIAVLRRMPQLSADRDAAKPLQERAISAYLEPPGRQFA